MRYCRRKDDIHQPGTEQRYFTGDGSREDNTAPVPIFWVKEVAYAGVRSSEFEVRGLEFGVRSSRFGVRQAAINRSRPRPRKRCSPFVVLPFAVPRSPFGVRGRYAHTPIRRYGAYLVAASPRQVLFAFVVNPLSSAPQGGNVTDPSRQQRKQYRDSKDICGPIPTLGREK